jgi:ATP-dependent Clp protease ATP-binding subunit ClpA
LRPEFVNRIDEVVLFKKLGTKNLEKLIQRLEGELNNRLSSHEFRIVVGERLRKELIGVGADGKFGGRAVRRAFQSIVVDRVSDRILESPQFARGVWVLDIDENQGYVWHEEDAKHKYLPPAKGF